jgi:DUF1365 family protein
VGRRVGQPQFGALYVGHVVHKRARPKRHSLRYGVFTLLVDLDTVEATSRGLKLFSVNRFNLFSLYARDFGPVGAPSSPSFVRRRAEALGLGNRVERISVLCYPRLLGFAFNPLTVYYLRDADERVIMLVYEVHNTFGERHFYDAVVEQVAGVPITHSLAKAFYVSPFNAPSGNYRFAVRPPADTVFTGITLSDAEGGLVTAYFQGERRELTDAQLLKLAIVYPFMTAKVVAGIYWEALKLWLKGVPLTLHLRRAPPASRPISGSEPKAVP